MGKVDLTYVMPIKDRRGVLRFYYRRNGQRQRILGVPGSTEFMKNYERIHASFQSTGRACSAPGTVAWMIEKFIAEKLVDVSPTTQMEYRRYLDAFRDKVGQFNLSGVTRKAIVGYHNQLKASPASANACLRVLKTLFNYAVYCEEMPTNPAALVEPHKIKSDGWEPWPEAALDRFAQDSMGASRHAFYLALYTGQRRGDCLKMRWSDISDGGISLRQGKTKEQLWIPIHPTLAAELDRIKADQKNAKVQPLFIVAKNNGTAYTDDGFGTIWQREQVRLDIRLPFHGLRKNATQALFEAGCTPQEVQAITGHKTLQMVQHYGRRSNQKLMAKSAMKKQTGNDSAKHEPE